MLLAERACGSPGALSEMPLVVVAQDSVQVVRDGQAQVRVATLNPQVPFATVTGPSLPQVSEYIRHRHAAVTTPGE